MKKLKVGTDFSGVGAFDQALIRLGIDYETAFACDMDKYARNTYLLNFGTPEDMELLDTPDVKKIDDIYYRGLVNTKLKAPTAEEWLFVEENEERLARMFSFYYPWNVYSRVIPKESVDISIHTCPCQAFSIAGNRKGEADRRGILFYNSHEFIEKNRPKAFVFENVKGLLSDDKGKTFARWISLLGGKSVNGESVLLPHEESVPYHVYYDVLNAKEHGVPQNRERIFIVGIRDDEANNFKFPNPFPLEKRLKDVLESNVDEKYFLSEKMVDFLTGHSKKHQEKGNGFNFKPKEPDSIASAITARVFKMGVDDNYIESQVLLNRKKFNDYVESGISSTITAGGTAGAHNLSLVEVNYTSVEIIQLNDPVHSNDRIYSDKGISPTLNTMQGGNRQPFVELSNEVIQLNPSKESGGKQPYQHNRVYDSNGIMPTLDTESKRKNILVPSNTKKGYDIAEEEEDSINFSNPNSKTRRGRVGKKVSQTLDTACNQGVFTNKRIRRLTPLECFRLMDFNKGFKADVADTHKYKQAGNSVVVKHFEDIVSILFKK